MPANHHFGRGSHTRLNAAQVVTGLLFQRIEGDCYSLSTN